MIENSFVVDCFALGGAHHLINDRHGQSIQL